MRLINYAPGRRQQAKMLDRPVVLLVSSNSSLGSSRPPPAEGDTSTYLAYGPWRVQPYGLARPLTHGLVPGWTGVVCHRSTLVRPRSYFNNGSFPDFHCVGCDRRAG